MGRTIATGLLLFVGTVIAPREAHAQVRGVYPTGSNATNAGVTPASTLTYSNLFLFNSRDELTGPAGETVATGKQAAMLDLNTFALVSPKVTWLGGARYSATATFIISNSSLASDTQGPLEGGGGFGDFFFQPFILGWQTGRVDVRVAYGILAPTGRFKAGADDNVGSGYWTQAPSAGVTFYLTKNKATAISAFQMYEVHSTQKGTDIQPGQTLNLDYSLTQTIWRQESLNLQIGLVGYSQWQTTEKSGPAVTSEERATRYQVDALGLSTNLMLPLQKASLGLKVFKEYWSTSTFKGYSLQIAGAIGF